MPSAVSPFTRPAPLVSCVMPAYNYGDYIAGAIESALAQDYPSEALEIVVVDDGSTDDTQRVVAPYTDRIHYIRKENGGINSAVNRALAESSGEFIAFLDADDEWPTDKVSRQVEAMLAQPDVGLLYGDLEVIDARGDVAAPSFWSMFGIEPRRGRVLEPLLGRNFITGGSMMVRAAFKERFHPMPDEAAWVDWWIALRVAEVAAVDFVPAKLYRYRLHGSNTNFGATGARLVRALERELRFRRWLLPNLSVAEVSPGAVASAVVALERVIATIERESGAAAAEFVASAPEQRASAAHELAAAEQASSDDVRIMHLGRAHAHDPLAPAVRDRLAAAGLLAAAPRAVAPAVHPEVRGFVTLAYAGELIEEPELLASYGSEIGASDDATLVIALDDDSDATLERLSAAVAAAGLDGDGSCDMLALRLDPPALATVGARAVLSGRPPRAAVASLSHFDAAGATELRQLAASLSAPAPA